MLRPHIHTHIPDELDGIEKEFEIALNKFELAQKTTRA